MTRGLQSWGGVPAAEQTPTAVHWSDALPAALASARKPTLAFGNGRSYGDSCHGAAGEVIHTRGLDRLVAVDWTTGVIRAEAGVTLGEILERSVPRGWFLPVLPGTGFVTLGGAVANDVHGKNHHRRGTFGRHVRAFGLVRSDCAPLTCTPSENSELFAATIGGLGLTGVIAWVEMQLMPVQSAAVDTRTLRLRNLEDFFLQSTRLDATNEYGVAWVDCMATGRSLGRGTYIAANHATSGATPRAPAGKHAVPFTPPLSLVNGLSVRVFNPLWWRLAPTLETQARMHYDPYFHPLDRILGWNRLYGPRGFQQFQCVLPDASAESGIAEILKTVAASGLASFLTVLKRCGEAASPGWLSFPMKGVSLAIDFAEGPRLARDLFPRLDALVDARGGRLYPAKDAHMSATHFQHAYPRWRDIERLRDPRLLSRFWQRVTA